MDHDIKAFDLVSEPWLPVRDIGGGGTPRPVSIREALATAHRVQLAADLPTMQIALLRLLLAVLHRAVDGPRAWGAVRALWQDPALPLQAIDRYLDTHRDRFDLLHPRTPFMQVADLTANTRAGGHKTPAVLRPERPTSLWTPTGLDQPMPFAEAARWLVHSHAYDPGGIKTGMVGDPRGTSGRVTAPGAAWLGWGTAIWPEGATLRDTLLLNLTPRTPRLIRDDLPVWERPADGPAAAGRQPTGPLDLYTWQSRRVRLVEQDGLIVGAMLGMGDPLHPADVDPGHEPHFAWRRSATQERKRNTGTVTMPVTVPGPALWSALTELLHPTAGGIPALALIWLPPDLTAHVRTVRSAHVMYGTMMAVVDDLRGDTLPGTVLTRQADAVAASSALLSAANAYARLAGDLVRAAGGGARFATHRDTARETILFDLEHSARSALTGQPHWRDDARQILTTRADQLVHAVPASAFAGRVIDGTHITPARSHSWFRAALNRAFADDASTPAERAPLRAASGDDTTSTSTSSPATQARAAASVAEPVITVSEIAPHDPMALLLEPANDPAAPTEIKDISRWRYNARDDAARQAKNAADRDYRRGLADAAFPRSDRDQLLELLATTPDVVQAAEQLGVTHSTVYARMRWDHDFADRVENVLREHCLARVHGLCGRDIGYQQGGRCAACRAAHRGKR